jgi:PII-like signaling protein
MRPFDPGVLPTSAIRKLQARIGGGAIVWRYMVLVPIEETQPGKPSRGLASFDDLAMLERVLAAHFRGVTVLPAVPGYGLRRGRLEMNRSVPYVIYVAPLAEGEEYVRVLKAELQDALAQETILVERQEVWIL